MSLFVKNQRETGSIYGSCAFLRGFWVDWVHNILKTYHAGKLLSSWERGFAIKKSDLAYPLGKTISVYQIVRVGFVIYIDSKL